MSEKTAIGYARELVASLWHSFPEDAEQPLADAIATAEERGRRSGLEERDERVRLCQLFVLAARWLIAGLQRDVEASEPAVLLYTPLRVAALRVLDAFQPPGTVRSFAGPESAALNELAAAARASATASDKPLGGESGEWWKAALTSLDLPSIPWGDEMATLRAAIAPRDSAPARDPYVEAGVDDWSGAPRDSGKESK